MANTVNHGSHSFAAPVDFADEVNNSGTTDVTVTDLQVLIAGVTG